MIKANTVREIIESAKVEDIVGDYVQLKRRGTNLLGLCPFHNEKTPSFNVNPARNIYKCFGCGRGGDAVNFLMEHEQLSFAEALRNIAAKYGIEIEEVELTAEQRAEQQLADSIFIANQFAQEFYEKQLFETSRGKSIGLSYFKSRGFREETIRKFGLGYAPNGWEDFVREANLAGHKTELLEKAGLVKNGRDFFRDRVMFTIRNLSGKVVGFGGRILQKNVKAPKYVNTPDTEVYHKSKILFGAYHAKQAIRRKDECILTEGYTDVISLHQSGIENVVASSGTSLTVDQIKLIKRYTPNVKMLFDGDAAGLKAALRGVDLLLEQDVNVKVVMLPDGEDPDSYLQQVGLSVFEDYLEDKAQDFIFFKSNLLLDDAGHDPIKRTAVIKDIVASIALIPDPLKRSLYIKECAKLVGVEERILLAETNKIIASKFKKHQQKAARQSAANTAPRKVTPTPQRGNAAPSFPDQEPPFFPTEEPFFPTEDQMEGMPPADRFPDQQEQAQLASIVKGDEHQERDLIRLLILFGDKEFDTESKETVAQFILHNIDDIIDSFDGELYKRIAKEFQVLLSRGEQPSLYFFKQHETKDIRELAERLSKPDYIYSENWEKRWEIVLNQIAPEDNFIKDSTHGLRRFRLRKLSRICDENISKIRELGAAGNEEELLLYLQLQQKLQVMRNDLAKDLGTVVF